MPILILLFSLIGYFWLQNNPGLFPQEPSIINLLWWINLIMGIFIAITTLPVIVTISSMFKKNRYR